MLDEFVNAYQHCLDAVDLASVNNIFESIEGYLFARFVDTSNGISHELFQHLCRIAVARLEF